MSKKRMKTNRKKKGLSVLYYILLIFSMVLIFGGIIGLSGCSNDLIDPLIDDTVIEQPADEEPDPSPSEPSSTTEPEVEIIISNETEDIPPEEIESAIDDIIETITTETDITEDEIIIVIEDPEPIIEVVFLDNSDVDDDVDDADDATIPESEPVIDENYQNDGAIIDTATDTTDTDTTIDTTSPLEGLSFDIPSITIPTVNIPTEPIISEDIINEITETINEITDNTEIEENEIVIIIEEPECVEEVEIVETETPEPTIEPVEIIPIVKEETTRMEIKPIASYENYYVMDDGNIYGIDGDGLHDIVIESVDGDILHPTVFYAIDGIAYYEVSIHDGGEEDGTPTEIEMIFKIENGISTEADPSTMPAKPASRPVEINTPQFTIISGEYNGMAISTVSKIEGDNTPSIAYLPITGAVVINDALYYCVSETFSIRYAGLYYWNDDNNSDLILGGGRLY